MPGVRWRRAKEVHIEPFRNCDLLRWTRSFPRTGGVLRACQMMRQNVKTGNRGCSPGSRTFHAETRRRGDTEHPGITRDQVKATKLWRTTTQERTFGAPEWRQINERCWALDRGPTW